MERSATKSVNIRESHQESGSSFSFVTHSRQNSGRVSAQHTHYSTVTNSSSVPSSNTRSRRMILGIQPAKSADPPPVQKSAPLALHRTLRCVSLSLCVCMHVCVRVCARSRACVRARAPVCGHPKYYLDTFSKLERSQVPEVTDYQ